MLDWLGKLASAPFINRPFFVVGGSRSGTIALLKAIGKHPRIFATPSEDPFITDIGGMVYQLEFCSEVEMDYYRRTLRVSTDYIYQSLRRLALESAIGKRYGFKQIMKSMLAGELNPVTKRYWCTKTFPSETVAQGLMKLYPETRFIWILRNGINVVHSRGKFPEFRHLPFEEHCHSWAESIMRFRYLFDLPQAVVVRHEEFVQDPERVFRRVFEHIGVEYSQEPVDFALTHHVHPLDDLNTTKGIDVRKVLSGRSSPTREWTETEQTVFRRICGEAMAQAGYELDF